MTLHHSQVHLLLLPYPSESCKTHSLPSCGCPSHHHLPGCPHVGDFAHARRVLQQLSTSTLFYYLRCEPGRDRSSAHRALVYVELPALLEATQVEAVGARESEDVSAIFVAQPFLDHGTVAHGATVSITCSRLHGTRRFTVLRDRRPLSASIPILHTFLRNSLPPLLVPSVPRPRRQRTSCMTLRCGVVNPDISPFALLDGPAMQARCERIQREASFLSRVRTPSF